jgi:ABC-2 type transport system ATP-binding protein
MSSSDLRASPHSLNTAKPGNAIEVDHIVKKFGDFTAVDDVSFNVQEEEIFGLLGPNGAGKSTLIRMMTTLIPITAGTARIAGHDVQTDPDDARRAIGVIPQALTSDIDLSVEENLSIYAKLYDVPAKKRKQSIDELLELVDLTKWRHAQTKTPEDWSTVRESFFSMSRPPDSIPYPASRFGRCSPTSRASASSRF